jgi:hypothetical protein
MNTNKLPANITLTRTCPFCGKAHSITVDRNEYYSGMTARERGALMQNAFPNFTPSQREFIMTGICDECWDNM